MTGSGKNAPSSFGDKFRRATMKTRSIVRFHSFDSSVVQVAKDDIIKFVEHLSNLFNLDVEGFD